MAEENDARNYLRFRRMRNELPSIEKLNAEFILHAEEGFLVRKITKAKHKAGELVGSNVNGYIHTKIDGKKYLLHRIIWKMYYGSEPPEIIDHIDRNRCNNKIKNLASSSYINNALNVDYKEMRGVHFDKSRGMWMAYIHISGKFINLGRFSNAKDAIRVRRSAERSVWGSVVPKKPKKPKPDRHLRNV